jgi:ABC-type transport system involved in multi-copper enzyme maturation permease subunit
MNWTLIKNTIQRLLGRSVTQLVIIGYAVFALVTVLTTTEGVDQAPNYMAQSAWFLTWALGTGLLGSDRSDGYLPLLLSRPISRAQYVLSRWAGLVICVVAVDLALHAIVALFYSYYQMDLMILPLLQRMLWFCYFVPLCAAWITLLSALFGGNGDLFYFTGASMALFFISSRFSEALTERVGAGLALLWMPGKFTFDAWISSEKASAVFSVFFFLVLAGTCLALAAWVMQRRDVSYVNR